MTLNKFVVMATQEPSGSFAPLVAAGGPLIAASAMIFRISFAESKWVIAATGFLIALILLDKTRKRRAASTCEVTVTVFPLGVQLARTRKSGPLRPPLFIPRDVILDVIVNEVILAHKVVSIVLFRVWKHDGTLDSDEKPPISTLLKEGRIHLVPAFPGVEMSYTDCQVMRRELSASLGLV